MSCNHQNYCIPRSNRCLYKKTNSGWEKCFISVNDTPDNSYVEASSNLTISCFKCGKFSVEEGTFLENQTIPSTKSKEIVLDLDNTLICAERENLYHADYSMSFGQDKYFVYERPYLKEFIEFLCQNYEKINIFTSSTFIYADIVVRNLNIPKDKIGWIKTREDCVKKRSPFNGEVEYMKEISDHLIIDDRPEVYDGINTIISIIPFYPWNNDSELLKVINLLNREEIKINQADLEVSLNGKFLHQEKNEVLPYSKVKEILKDGRVSSFSISGGLAYIRFDQKKETYPDYVDSVKFLSSFGLNIKEMTNEEFLKKAKELSGF